jgi:hypothetical protein
MNRYEITNAVHKVEGYFNPPSVSDHYKISIEQAFELAKNTALQHMRKSINDVEKLQLCQFLPNYKGSVNNEK